MHLFIKDRNADIIVDLKLIMHQIQSMCASMCSIQLLLMVSMIVCDVISISHNDYKTIETNDGPVRGKLGITLLNNVSYHSFKGIPYAKPPTGNLRFKVNT